MCVFSLAILCTPQHHADEGDPLLEDGGEGDGGEGDGDGDGGGVDGDGGAAAAGQARRGGRPLASGADGTDPSKPDKRKNTLMAAKEVLNKGSKQDMAAVFGALKQYLAKQGTAKKDLQVWADPPTRPFVFCGGHCTARCAALRGPCMHGTGRETQCHCIATV